MCFLRRFFTRRLQPQVSQSTSEPNPPLQAISSTNMFYGARTVIINGGIFNMIVNGESGRSSSIICIPNSAVDRHRESDSKSTSGRCECCYWYCWFSDRRYQRGESWRRTRGREPQWYSINSCLWARHVSCLLIYMTQVRLTDIPIAFTDI